MVIVANTYNPNTWEVGRKQESSHPQLLRKFKASLGYRPCFNMGDLEDMLTNRER